MFSNRNQIQRSTHCFTYIKFKNGHHKTVNEKAGKLFPLAVIGHGHTGMLAMLDFMTWTTVSREVIYDYSFNSPSCTFMICSLLLMAYDMLTLV